MGRQGRPQKRHVRQPGIGRVSSTPSNRRGRHHLAARRAASTTRSSPEAARPRVLPCSRSPGPTRQLCKTSLQNRRTRASRDTCARFTAEWPEPEILQHEVAESRAPSHRTHPASSDRRRRHVDLGVGLSTGPAQRELIAGHEVRRRLSQDRANTETIPSPTDKVFRVFPGTSPETSRQHETTS